MKESGFSLMELLVVVAIVGILSAVAIPSYSSFKLNTYRQDVLAELQSLEMAMQQFAFENHTYLGAAEGHNDTGKPHPIDVYKLNKDLASVYAVTIDSATKIGFQLKATPLANQVSDKCGVITLDSRGVQTFTKNGVDVTDECTK